MKAKSGEGRWLVKKYCGCRVPNPAKSRSAFPVLSIKHCDLHTAASEMLYFIAEIYFSHDPRWQEKVDSLLHDEFFSRAWDDMRRDFKRDFTGEKRKQLLAYYVDAEKAILEGKRHVDRTKTTCRLCEATLEDDDLARLLHLRSSHWKEWRRLNRV